MTNMVGTSNEHIKSTEDDGIQKTGDATIAVLPSNSEDGAASDGDDDGPLSKDELRVLLKLDFQLLPVLTFCYTLQFLDKSSLGFASILGIIQETNLQGSQYSWTNSIFFFGYLIFSYPSSILIVKFPIGKYLSTTVIIWALILMLHAACKNFQGLMAVRFFLGVFEATVAPGFAILIGTFYKRREQPLRQYCFFIGNGLAGIFGGLVAYGIAHINGKLSVWKYLFLVYGTITVFWGAFMLWYLPDTPAKARFLSEKQKEIAIQRARHNGGKKNSQYNKKQIIAALKDPQAWLLACEAFCVNVATGGFSGYGNLLIQGFGFDLFSTLLLQIPFAFAQIFFMIVGGFMGTFVKNARLLTMFGLMLVSIAGTTMMWLLPDDKRVAKVAGGCLASAFGASLPMSMSLVTSNVVGFTKKSTVMSMLFIAYCLGHIVGPQFFLSEEAPKYRTGLKAILGAFSCAAFLSLALRAYLMRENRKRDRETGAATVQDGHKLPQLSDDYEDSELTDREIKSFRYML